MPSSKPHPVRAVTPTAKVRRSTQKSSHKPGAASPAASASELIDSRFAELGGWRGALLARLRALIKTADPEVTEEWKWSTPVWSHGGIVCTGEAYKQVVKMTFAKGASLADPAGLFNSSLEGNVRRAIDFHEGDVLDEAALKALFRAAVALNQASSARGKPASPPVALAPVAEKIAEPPGNLAARARAFAKRSGSR